MEYTKFFQTTNYGGWGIGWNFGLDADIGYNFPIQYLYTGNDNLLLNPQVYFEVASHSYMDIILPNIEYRIRFDFSGYKYTIVDYVFLFDINNTTNYCSGLSWL